MNSSAGRSNECPAPCSYPTAPGGARGGPVGSWVNPLGPLVDTILGVVKGRKWMFHQYDGKMDGNILDYTFDYTLVYTYYSLLCHILGW